jgi:ankyrin repeat protein
MKLNLASEKGHLNVVKVLLKHGASANIKEYDGHVPLHIGWLLVNNY